MRKRTAFVIALIMLFALATVPVFAAEGEEWTCPVCGNIAAGDFCSSCGAAKPGQEGTTTEAGIESILDLIAAATGHALTAVNPSPDKYTWYVKDYVGQNVASVGYTSMGGDRLDAYGAGYLELVLVTKDGTYVDIDNEDMLKEYVVIGQNLSPNTELKYTFETDSEGNEYDNLVSGQNYDTIDLLVARVDGALYGDQTGYEPFAEDPSDRYTHHIRNYVGKNLASVGYTSMGGDRLDAYGAGYLQFVFTASDGSSIDVNDERQLAGYVITGQDIPANAAMTYTYMTDSEGNEYSNLVSDQSYEKITFSLKPVSILPEAFAAEETTDEPDGTAIEPTAAPVEEAAEPAESDIRPEIKEAIDSYEEFFNEYVDFMGSYDPSDLGSMVKYLSMVAQYTETMQKLDDMENADLNDAELIYYTQATLRIDQRLLEVAG